MPSIKKRVTGFIRQISGPSSSQSEARVRAAPVSPPPQYEKCFIQRYLAGESRNKQPDIHYAKTGHSLPSYTVDFLQPEVFAAYTGPQGGITCISRMAAEEVDRTGGTDVDYIDLEEGRLSTDISRRTSMAVDLVETFERGASLLPSQDTGSIRVPKSPVYIDNSVMTIRVMDRIYRVDDTRSRNGDKPSSSGSTQPWTSDSASLRSSGYVSSIQRSSGSVSGGSSQRGSVSSARGSISSSASDEEPASPLFKTSDIVDIDEELDLIETEDGYLPVRSLHLSQLSPDSKIFALSSPVKPVSRPNFLNLTRSGVSENSSTSQGASESADPLMRHGSSPLPSTLKLKTRPGSLDQSFDKSRRISFNEGSTGGRSTNQFQNSSTQLQNSPKQLQNVLTPLQNMPPLQSSTAATQNSSAHNNPAPFQKSSAQLRNRSTSLDESVKNSNTESRSSQQRESSKLSHEYPELKPNQLDAGLENPDPATLIQQNKLILDKLNIDLKDDISTSLAGIRHWNRPNSSAYGVSDSLYERNPVNGEQAGSPIADTYAVVARKNSAILVLGDGVNWGARAALASRAAVHGAMNYLNTALFGISRSRKLSTQDVFQILLRSFHAAHCSIIEQDAMLTTLTAAVVLPTSENRFHFCVCNVGDSLAYVYSKGEVREVTQGSHDITANRDMRDALGALGPVDGLNPELSNLTCSITEVLPGDIVFLTSDGISDNFDPVVGKFCVPRKPGRSNPNKAGGGRGRRGPEMEPLPTVEGFQRHELTLLRIEDILNHDWGSSSLLNSGCGRVENAAELCQRMLDFCQRLTNAKRKILEDPELYTEEDSDMQDQKLRRRRVCEKLALVPGKLDHATITAYQVGDRTQELQDYTGDRTDLVSRYSPALSAPRASCEDLTMRDSPDSSDDVTPTPSISLDSTPLASGASSLAVTPTHSRP